MKVAIEDEFCTGCGNCTISCPGNFPIHWPEIEFGRELEIKNGRVILAGELCNGCGVCVESCPFDAIKIIPNEQKEVEKTETIYEVSKRKYVSKETKLDVNPRLNDMFQSIRKTFSTAPLRSMFEYSDVKIEKIVNFVNDFEKKYKYKTSIHERDPNERIKDFLEAIEGYTLKDAIKEAERCQNCAGPRCMEGCPLKVDIPYFIEKIKENDIQKAAEIIKRKNPFPAITGRVCPQELQCESRCAYNFSDCEPVAIGKLERFVGDWALKLQLQTRNTASKVDHMGEREGIKEIGITKYKKKIAVVGSGPSGLACAVELAKKGYEVTIFETLHKPGGVLIYGIPEFRLPKETVEEEIEYVIFCVDGNFIYWDSEPPYEWKIQGKYFAIYNININKFGGSARILITCCSMGCISHQFLGCTIIKCYVNNTDIWIIIPCKYIYLTYSVYISYRGICSNVDVLLTPCRVSCCDHKYRCITMILNRII